jgi:hypothetical protein
MAGLKNELIKAMEFFFYNDIIVSVHKFMSILKSWWNDYHHDKTVCGAIGSNISITNFKP